MTKRTAIFPAGRQELYERNKYSAAMASGGFPLYPTPAPRTSAASTATSRQNRPANQALTVSDQCDMSNGRCETCDAQHVDSHSS